MENSLTVEQVLQICVDQLNAIQLTIEQMDTTGASIKRVIQNINACLEAMTARRPEEPDEQEAEEQEDGRETDDE